MTSPTPQSTKKIEERIDDVLHDFGVAEGLSETQLADKLKRKVITADEFDDRLVENYRKHKGEAKTELLTILKETCEEALPSKRIQQDDEDIEDEFSGKALAHELQENNINIGYNLAIDQVKGNIRKLIGEDK